MASAPAERYFDHAATTPLDPRVLAEMMPFLSGEFGNAHSIHSFGTRAMAAVDRARARVALLIGAEDPSQIYFTSGATEANNWIIRAFPGGAYSPFEHSAVREPAIRAGYRPLANAGTQLRAPSPGTSLLSVMSVNNEIGTRFSPGELSGAQRVHSDITQQVGKLPIDLSGIDFATFSAHKFYGPKGVGALYVAEEPPEPLLRGGEQENGFRGGTLNVPGIVGMGAAAAIAVDELSDNLDQAVRLREIVIETLESGFDWQINGGPRISPYILSVSFRTITGESLVVEADAGGFAISAGAACSSRSTEPSHVLMALGLTQEWRNGTVRISFGRTNTAEAARDLARGLLTHVEKLRTLT